MSIDKRTLESYNNYARKWAERMRSGKNSAHDLLEKPAMEKLLPDLRGKKILCVGCGSGEECGRLLELGANEIVGVDVSDKLLEIARESYPGVKFIEADIETLDLESASIDLVYSSLVMHYMPDWTIALSNIRRILKPGAHFIFSTHHPLFNSLEKIKENDLSTRLYGVSWKNNRLNRVYGDYYSPRLIEDVWFGGEFEVNYFHRPLENLIADILAADFRIAGFYEPRPVEAARNDDPDIYGVHTKLPLFLIFDLVKD